jgi:ABC-type phosphate/phosphonate transport system substrate-binding protein
MRQCEVAFRTDDSVYRDPSLLIGHTCGYPYLKSWRSSHRPVAVPVFNIPGCSGTNYCSWLVCRDDDPRSALSEFRGTRAVINHADSNSGMNALRHAVRDQQSGGRFFSGVTISGTHIGSMRRIARQESDLAAIDAVTWHFFQQQEPATTRALRVIGRTAECTALPFIQHRSADLSAGELNGALNRALDNAPTHIREMLCLESFRQVDDTDYARLTEMESEAIACGYSELA